MLLCAKKNLTIHPASGISGEVGGVSVRSSRASWNHMQSVHTKMFFTSKSFLDILGGLVISSHVFQCFVVLKSEKYSKHSEHCAAVYLRHICLGLVTYLKKRTDLLVELSIFGL